MVLDPKNLSPFHINKQFELLNDFVRLELFGRLKEGYNRPYEAFLDSFEYSVGKVFEKLNELLSHYGATPYFKQCLSDFLGNYRKAASQLPYTFRKLFKDIYESDQTILANDLNLLILEGFYDTIQTHFYLFDVALSEYRQDVENGILPITYATDREYKPPRYLFDDVKIAEIHKLFNGVIWQEVPFNCFCSCFDLNVSPSIKLIYINQNAFVYLLVRISNEDLRFKPDAKVVLARFGISNFYKHRSTASAIKPPLKGLYQQINTLVSNWTKTRR